MENTLRNIEPGRPARVGQLILQRRYNLARRILGEGFRWGRLLDIGCGNGAQTRFFARQADFTAGIDITPMNQTESPVLDAGIAFTRGDTLRLPFASDSFDAVTTFEVLEHVPDDAAMLGEIYRVLKPGGTLILSAPNRWWVFETHGANVPGFNWLPWNRMLLLSWLPKGLHDRVAKARIYRRRELTGLIEAAGFQVVDSGYITAPLDVLPDCALRDFLRWAVFRGDTTRNPLLAVNLWVVGRKGGLLKNRHIVTQ